MSISIPWASLAGGFDHSEGDSSISCYSTQPPYGSHGGESSCSTPSELAGGTATLLLRNGTRLTGSLDNTLISIDTRCCGVIAVEESLLNAIHFSYSNTGLDLLTFRNGDEMVASVTSESFGLRTAEGHINVSRKDIDRMYFGEVDFSKKPVR